ncbi:MAG: thiamine monophosphate synthase [Caulobacteraceae bacterium]|nr:thiamine monophosphate synthase [Caulobacteraceae bacterium]
MGRTLSRAAVRRNPGSAGLPPLILVSDPDRTPHIEALAGRLPRGSGLIYRAFGAAKAGETARRLARIAHARGQTLLIGADAVRAPGAGVHLPERLAHRAGALKRARPGVIVTVAAHSLPALRRARIAGADAALLSAVFNSASPSAGRPLGSVRFAALVRQAGLPVYALGGVHTKNAPRLLGSGAAGLAMAAALAAALRS